MPIEGQYRGRAIMSGQVRSRRLLSSQMQGAAGGLGYLQVGWPARRSQEVDSWVMAVYESVPRDAPPAVALGAILRPFASKAAIKRAFEADLSWLATSNGGHLPKFEKVPVAGAATPLLLPVGVFEPNVEDQIRRSATAGFAEASRAMETLRNPTPRAGTRAIVSRTLGGDVTTIDGAQQAAIGAVATLGSMVDIGMELATATTDYDVAIGVLNTIGDICIFAAPAVAGVAPPVGPIAGIVLAAVGAVAKAIATILDEFRTTFQDYREIGLKSYWNQRERRVILMERLRLLVFCPEGALDTLRGPMSGSNRNSRVERYLRATAGSVPLDNRRAQATAICDDLGRVGSTSGAQDVIMINEICTWLMHAGVGADLVNQYRDWLTKARLATVMVERAGFLQSNLEAGRIRGSVTNFRTMQWARGRRYPTEDRPLTHRGAGKWGGRSVRDGSEAWIKDHWGLDSFTRFTSADLAEIHTWLYRKLTTSGPRSTGFIHQVSAAPRAAGVTVEAMGFRCHARQGLNQNAVPAASRDAYTNAVAHGHPWGATCSRIGGASSATVTSPVGVYVSGSSGSKSAPLPFWGSKGGGMGGVGGPTTVSSSISSQDAAFIRTPEFQNALGQAIEGAVSAPSGRSVVPYVLGGVVLASGIGIYFLSKK